MKQRLRRRTGIDHALVNTNSICSCRKDYKKQTSQ